MPVFQIIKYDTVADKPKILQYDADQQKIYDLKISSQFWPNLHVESRNKSKGRKGWIRTTLKKKIPQFWNIFPEQHENATKKQFKWSAWNDPQWGVGGWLKKSKKKPARAGWPRRLALVRGTSRAEVDVIGAQLCSCTRAIFSSITLSWSDCSLPLIIVDNSPNLHNTGFFPDCFLLSVTNGSIWIPYLARYSEIFKKPNFQVVKWKSTFIWKMLSQAELVTERSVKLQSLVCFPQPLHTAISVYKFWIFGFSVFFRVRPTLWIM